MAGAETAAAGQIRLAVASFKDKHDNKPNSSRVSWDKLSQTLMRHAVREEKDGPLWSPVRYDAGVTRANAGVNSVSCLVFDYDKGTRPEEFERGWEGLEYCAHSTFQHTSEEPRYRVVFPLAAPIPGEEWPHVYRGLAKQFGGPTIDPSCKDCSRMYYLPAHPPGGEGIAWAHEGKLLDADAFRRPKVDLLVQRAKEHLNEGRNAAGLWLACQMRDNGYTEFETESASWNREVPTEHVRPNGKVDVYDRDEWTETVRKAFGRPARAAWSKNGREAPAEHEGEETGLIPLPTFYTLADLRDRVLPPVMWAVEGFIPEGCTMLNAHSKVGKTFLAEDVAVAVALGGMAWGKVKVNQGRVLYLDTEGNQRRVQGRIRNLLGADPWPAELLLTHEAITLDPSGLLMVRLLLTKYRPRLLVLDTFNAMRPGRKPTSDLVKEDYDLLRGLRSVGEEFHCANLLLHHSSLTKKDDSVNSGSGTHGLAAAASAVLSFTRKRGEHDAIMAVTGNDIEREQEYHFTRDQRTGFWTLAGSGEEFMKTGKQQRIRDVVKALGKTGPAAVAAQLGEGYDSVKKMMQRMAKEGELIQDSGEYAIPVWAP